MLHNLSHPTFHVPLSCQPLLSISARSLAVQGCFSCRSALGTLLLRLQVAIFELEMRERTFRTLHSRLKIEVAMFELELRERASHATFARKHSRLTSQPELELLRECTSRTTLDGAMGTCSSRALYLKLANFQPELRERYFCTYNLRFRSRTSGNALRILLWCLNLVNFRPAISAEGSPSSRQIRTAPRRERFSAQVLRKGLTASKTNSHGTTARAPRHAQSPQKVRRAQDKFAQHHTESASTRTISAKGSLLSRSACK